jgi:uncharacterized protein GlcG (DUF336 family)
MRIVQTAFIHARGRATDRERRLAALLLALLCLILPSCSGGGGASPPGPPPAPPAFMPITAAEVTAIATRAASVASIPMVIAVTDRSGNILGVFRKPGAPVTAVGNFSQVVDTNELAVSLARTASFFSHNEAPLSSRTVRFISGVHFPPGVEFVPNAALYGIENTNRGCVLSTNFAPGKTLPIPRNIAGTAPGLGITTGKADVFDSVPNAVNPGGVPFYRGSTFMGGVGVVAGAAGDTYAVAEFAAAVGAGGLPPGIGGLTAVPNPLPAPGVVFVDGVALPFVNNLSLPAGFTPDPAPVLNAVVAATNSPGPTPDGDLVLPANGPLGGLTAAEVRTILDNAIAVAQRTRGIIRLPLGTRAKFVIAVADLDGTIIGLHRQPDATIFSVDVAVSKARNMIYFNLPTVSPMDMPGVPPGTAVTNRTISFGTQPLYPPGLDPTPFPAGPFFQLYLNDTANPCTQGFQAPGPNQSGIVFFPGSVGLYRNGVLVGGLGVSGDGVEQDDYVTACAVDPTDTQCPITGQTQFLPPAAMRADQLFVQGTRLPFMKFPRNPTD